MLWQDFNIFTLNHVVWQMPDSTVLQMLPELFFACSGQTYFSVGWVLWGTEWGVVQKEVTAKVTSATPVPQRIGIPTVPCSTVSNFSGNCSFLFFFFVLFYIFFGLALPFPFVCVCACLYVWWEWREEGGEEKSAGLSTSTVTSRYEAFPELK